MSLNLALSTALSGLLTTQKGLDLVAHNISNINTEGYTRKIYSPESVVLAGRGAGVQGGAITRRVEDGLLKDLRESRGVYSQIQMSSDYMGRVQDLFGTPKDNSSLSHAVADLLKQFDVLTTDTDNAAQTSSAVKAGATLANRLNALSQQLQELRGNADKALQGYTGQVNTILANLDAINDKITLANATQGGSPDLLDKRDNELNKLSELLDITYYEHDGGAVSVFTKSGATLLDSAPQTVTHVGLTSVSPWDSASAGDIQGIMVGGVDITNDLRSGKIKALVDMRDGELVNLQAQIDELTQELRETLNQAHNRGTSFPTMATSYQGSKTFVRTAEQTFQVTDGQADSAIILFNSDGTQKAKTTLRELMTTDFSDTSVHPDGGPEASSANGPWTMQDYAAHLQSWLRDNGMSSAAVGFGDTDATTYTVNSSATASVTGSTITDTGQFTGIKAGMAVTINGTSYTVTAADDDSITLDKAPTGFTAGDTIVASAASGKMNVTLNDSRYGLSFRDQKSSVAGSDPSDLPIGFDSDGDGDIDETHEGLSNFLGLNDFFASTEENWLWESKVQPTNYSQFGATRLTFTTAGASHSLSIQPGDSLEDIAARINSDETLRDSLGITASVIKEGTGQRLRIRNSSGQEMVITGSNPTQFDTLGLGRAATGQSRSLKVNDTLTAQPDRLSKGRPQFDKTTGEYFLSSGDNSVALDITKALSDPHTFDSAGGLTTGAQNFADYAASIISGAATRANATETELTYQKGLNQSLEMKNAEISAVSLDEELVQLMAFQQSYSAAAKVISTTQSLFDVLNNIVR